MSTKEKNVVEASAIKTKEKNVVEANITNIKEKNKPETSASRLQSIIDAVWNDYETSLASAQSFLEEREDAYLTAISEVREFLERNRDYVEEFVENVAEANNAIVRSLVAQVQTERIKPFSEAQMQFENIVPKLQELAWTPWRRTVEFMSSMEERWEQGNLEFIHILRDQRKLYNTVTDEWIASAKKFQNAIFQVI